MRIMTRFIVVVMMLGTGLIVATIRITGEPRGCRSRVPLPHFGVPPTPKEIAMGRRVFVVGVGMTKFEKPGSTGKDYPPATRDADRY